MKIFIDFDDVLFDTRQFVVDIKKAFADNGIGEKLFQKSYIDYPVRDKSGKIKKYDPWKHIQILEKEYKFDGKRLKEEIDEIVKNSHRYIFSDALNFLKIFSPDDLYIVSYGDNKFQEKKIFNSKLAMLIRKAVVNDNLKSISLSQLSKSEKINFSFETAYFLDDRVEQVESVKKAYPEIITFLIKRQEGRYKDEKNEYCDYAVENFIQVAKIINKNKKTHGSKSK